MNQQIIETILAKIADYRSAEIGPRTKQHIVQWANQFDAAVRDPLLAELAHVLEHTYFSRSDVEAFLTGIVKSEKIAGDDPCSYWRDARLLDIQQRGASQRELLSLFQDILERECGIRGTVARDGGDTFVYLDDALFTGNHVRRDIEAWVNDDAPTAADVLVIVVALHEGSYYHQGELDKAIAKSGKKIKVHWWRCITLEDRKKYINNSDVLRPRAIPADAKVQEYVGSFKYDVALRTSDGRGNNKIFSSEEGRNLLEQVLLCKGVYIREICPHLGASLRPLGFTSLEMLGFGSTFVTYRNCPNNCPLAFWAGDPWVPLFPRKINEQKFDWGF